MNGAQPQKIKLVIKKDALAGQSGAPPAAQPPLPNPSITNGEALSPDALPRSHPEPSATASQGAAAPAAAPKPAFKFKVTLGPNKPVAAPSGSLPSPPAAAAPRLPGPKRPAPGGGAPGPKRPKLNAKPKGPKIPKLSTKIKLKSAASGGPTSGFGGSPGGGGGTPAVVKFKVKPSLSLGGGGLPPPAPVSQLDADMAMFDFGAPPPGMPVKQYKRRGRKPKSAMPANLGDRPSKATDDVSFNVNIKPREYSLRNITSNAALVEEEGADGGSPPFMVVPASEAPAAPAMPLPVVAVKPGTKEDFEKVLAKVWDKDTKSLFRQPVTDAMAPNYSQIITNPMDLGTMKVKVAAGEYKDWDEFDADLMLIFDNALMYNLQGDPIWKISNNMKAQAIRFTNNIKLGKKPTKGGNSAAVRKQTAAAKAQQRAERDLARSKARQEQRAAHEAKILKKAGLATGSSLDEEENLRMTFRRPVQNAETQLWRGLGGGANAHGVPFVSVGRLALQPRNPTPSAASVAASLARFAGGLTGKLKELVLGRMAQAEAAAPGPALRPEEIVSNKKAVDGGAVGGATAPGGGMISQMGMAGGGAFMGMGMGMSGFGGLGVPQLPVQQQQ